MHGYVGTTAHGDANIRRSQSRRIVYAVADHRHHGAALFQLCHGGGLVRRQHFGMHVVDVQCFCHHPRAAPVVAGDQVAADIPRREPGNRRCGAVLEAVTESKQAEDARLGRLFHQPGQGAALGFPALGGFQQLARLQAVLFEHAPVAQRQLLTIQRSGDAAAAQGLALLHIRHGDTVGFAALQHGARQWVFAATLQGAGQAQYPRFVAVHGMQVDDLRLAGGERAGLVEGHRRDRMGDFQRFGVLDQDAVARRHAGAGHDRRRCGKAEGARAGDDQHGHRVDQCNFGRRASEQPADQGEHGYHQHRRDEHLADPVHQLLDRCLGRLGVFHQADDPRQHGLATERGGAHQQAPLAIDRAAGDAVARRLVHRQALAADQCFVGLAFAFEHFAVHRETLAGLDQHQVVQAQRGDGDVFLAAVDYPCRAVWAQGFERANGGAGLALGAAFQVFAQQHQSDHHRRGLEIQVRHLPGWCCPPLIEAQAVTGAGADGDQQVHVAGTSAHGLPAGDVEARTEDELHRRGEQELDPCRQHPVLPEQLAEHRQHQRCGQQQAGDHRPAFALQAPLGILFRALPAAGACLVAGGLDRLDQRSRVRRADHFDMRALAGQVHRGAAYTGHLEQRPLDPADAAGAGHAFDVQLDALQRHAVAGFFHGGDQCRHAQVIAFDAHLFIGQIDIGRGDAGYLEQGPLDAAGAAGAGHTADRQRMGGAGHGRDSSGLRWPQDRP